MRCEFKIHVAVNNELKKIASNLEHGFLY